MIAPMLLSLLLAAPATSQPRDLSDVPVTRIVFGSCIRQNDPQPIRDAVLAAEPDVFIFAGGNVYAENDAGANFGVVDIDWRRKAPTVPLSTRDVDGKAAIEHTVKPSELQAGVK